MNLESKILEWVSFRINLRNTRRNKSPKFYKASDFEGKCLWKLKNFWKSLLSKNQLLWVTLHSENKKVGTFMLSRKSWFWHFFGKKEHIFNQNFRAASQFETSFSKHVRFWTKVLKHVISWAKILKFLKNWIENLITCQIFKLSGEIFFRKVNLSVVLNRWNVKTSVFLLSWKAWFWEGNFGQKHSLNLKF